MSTVFDEKVMDDGNPNTNSLLKRVFIFLEDGDWETARNYCERVLDIDPENALAYLGKLMAGLHVNKPEKLKDRAEPFDNNVFYKRAILFADEKLKNVLTGYIEHINNRNEKARLDEIYTRAKNGMSVANTETDYKKAALLFECISDYQDSMVLAQECYEKAEITRKNTVLAEGKAKMTGKKVSNYESAIKLFESISGWKDADEMANECQRKTEEIKAKKKKRTKIAICIAPIVCAIIVFSIILLKTVIIPNHKYNNAIALMDEGKYEEAITVFETLDGYKDSTDKANSLRYLSVKVGNYVKFGVYEQDNDNSNGKEKIEWLVLDVKDGKALLISKYALDFMPYNESRTDVTWESSTLRNWLNNDFINSSFSVDEKAMISKVTVSADKNPKYSTNPGNATEDKVFLLSITEANKYFSSNKAMVCNPTSYASKKINVSPLYSRGWWLRSPASGQLKAAYVYPGGSINNEGDYVNANIFAIRPAMWIDLNY